MVETKQCTKCGETKSRDGFFKDNSKKNGLCSWCKECEKKHRRVRDSKCEYAKRLKKEPRFNYKKKLKTKYGITLDDYDQMLEQQKGVCAICRAQEIAKNSVGLVQRLSVDHNHETGEIRGLLCAKCNRGLGCFDDDPKMLAEAIRYLL